MRRGLIAGVCAICALCLYLAAGASGATSPTNDDFAEAQVIAGPLPTTVGGTTVGATRELGEPTPPRWMQPAGHSIWFRWQAPTTEDISLNACDGEGDPLLAVVYTGSALSSLTEIADNGQHMAPFSCLDGEKEAVFTAHAGTVYSVWLDDGGVGSMPAAIGEGGVELELRHARPPANDDFVDAETISTGELPDRPAREGAIFTIDNRGASKESGEPAHDGNQGGASVWFDWTATRSGGVYLQGCDGEPEQQPLLAVYTGSTVGDLTPVPHLEGWVNANCEFLFYAIAGVTYRIAADGPFDAAIGGADMFETQGELFYFPPNDDFARAEPLLSSLSNGSPMKLLYVGAHNLGATKQPGEPDHAGNPGGASVWFTWTAPLTGSVQMSACDADFPTLLAVYAGSELTDLTPVASGNSTVALPCPMQTEGQAGEVGFNTVAGVTYDVAVDGFDGDWGTFNLELWATGEPLKPAEVVPPVRPTTTIVKRRIDPAKGTATFLLHSNVAGAGFRCRLDKHHFGRCGTKVTYRHLAPGHHTFRAAALTAGASDLTPARQTFKIARAPHRQHQR